jgi:predicted small secreted protein
MKNTFKRLGIIALLAVTSLVTAACGPEIPVSGVELEETATVSVNRSKTLVATVKPGDATNTELRWKSLKPEIVEVNNLGKITGKAVGIADVYVTTVDGGFTALCRVTVVEGGGDVSLGATLSIIDAQVYLWGDVMYTGTVTGLNYVPVAAQATSSGPKTLELNKVFDGTNSVTLKDGKLSIKFGTPKAAALEIVTSEFNTNLVSNKSAKVFILETITDNDKQAVQVDEVFYMYADRDFTIIGTDTDTKNNRTETYDCKFKKGWNMVIRDHQESGDTDTITYKTGNPTGLEKWYYYGDDDGGGGGSLDWANIDVSLVIEEEVDKGWKLYASLEVWNNDGYYEYYDPIEEGFTCQWYRDDVAISGATSSSYTIRDSDVGKKFGVEVRGYRKLIITRGFIVQGGGGNQTPAVSDYTISGIGTFTYNGSPRPVSVTAKAGKSPGAVTVFYSGSTFAPSAVGTYSVTFDVAAAGGWDSAQGLYAGMLRINPSGSGGGTFTLSGIPSQFNGNYAMFTAAVLNGDDQDIIYGFQSVSSTASSLIITLSPISNGSVSIPALKMNLDDEPYDDVLNFESYSGNGEISDIGVGIYDSQTIRQQGGSALPLVNWLSRSPNVYFSNGSASMSWSQGETGVGGEGSPTNVTAMRTPTSDVNVNWNAVSGAAYYEVYSATDLYSLSYYEGSSDTTSLTSTGNRMDATVYFRVVAVNSEGERSYPSTWAKAAPIPGEADNNGFLGAALALSGMRVYKDEYLDHIGYAYVPFYGTVDGLNTIYLNDDEGERDYFTLDEIFDGTNSVTLTGGNLSINLGTPKSFALKNIMDDFDDEVPFNLTIDNPNAKYFTLSSNIYHEDDSKWIECNDGVTYMYVDRDVTISGSGSLGGDGWATAVVNMNLKTGWNSVIQISEETSDSYKVTMKTGVFTGKVKWVYENYSILIPEPEGSKTSGGAAARRLFPWAGKK